MSVYEAPTSLALEMQEAADIEICGVNCDWGFGVGIVIAMVGPLPGPT